MPRPPCLWDEAQLGETAAIAIHMRAHSSVRLVAVFPVSDSVRAFQALDPSVALLGAFSIDLCVLDIDPSNTINILLYVGLAIIISLVIVMLYFVYQYWWFKNHGVMAHPDYEEIRDADGNVIQQANTICSVGPGIRMDNAPTRPKLQTLRSSSLLTSAEQSTKDLKLDIFPRCSSSPTMVLEVIRESESTQAAPRRSLSTPAMLSDATHVASRAHASSHDPTTPIL
ncbi:Aste57867_1639 [Aphanomyces stellatus]|uniref:Aste57867_1639 protein n=1 Tax=Aphanomyces stellatus TaxID=120398 RepID=A0A485KB45_9STRA|nr:hypothetical protein As57867_001637 [Aphanomyces stellatus]VFT78852.1 Aste57867_1639 [Aphanomyces stellatus]